MNEQRKRLLENLKVVLTWLVVGGMAGWLLTAVAWFAVVKSVPKLCTRDGILDSGFSPDGLPSSYTFACWLQDTLP